MKVLHINYNTSGGAARAAIRIVKAQIQFGIEAKIFVRSSSSDYKFIECRKNKFDRAIGYCRPTIGNTINKILGIKQNQINSGNWIPSSLSSYINNDDCEIVNLHWVGGETMSIEDIGRIKKPIVWTMHDMWPFLGCYHYENLVSTQNSNRLKEDVEKKFTNFFDSLVKKRKIKNFKKNIGLVYPSSKFFFELISKSFLKENNSVKIYHPIPKEFKKIDKQTAREILNIDKEKIIILFGAMGGTSDPRKGYDLYIQALKHIKEARPEFNSKIISAIFGQNCPKNNDDDMHPFETKWLGRFEDEISLAIVYSAADVMVVPSRQEAFGQTALEALACGCPVVGFNNGGLLDIVEDGKSGFLVEPFNVVDMADSITKLFDKDLNEQFSKFAIENIDFRFNENQIAKQYLDFYKKIISIHENTKS